jgi:hypothetical protein
MNEKDQKAKDLIEDFTKQLFELSESNELPSHWKIWIKDGLQKKKGKQGQTYDYDQVVKVVGELAKHLGELEKPNTKHSNLGRIKDDIAKKTGVSRKTVDRYYDLFKENISGYQHFEDDPSDIHKAIIDGVAEAIHQKMIVEETQEEKRKKKKPR